MAAVEPRCHALKRISATAGLRAQAPRCKMRRFEIEAELGSAPLGGEIRGRKTVAELGMTNLAAARGFDHGPGLGIGEQRLQHEHVEAMATAARAEGAEDGRAGQREVADGIERLVAHELVGVAQPFAD